MTTLDAHGACLMPNVTNGDGRNNWRHDAQYNDTQHNDIQHNDTQHNNK
jgi:hypothetical protein